MNYKNVIKGFDIVAGSEINEKLETYQNEGALRGKYLGFPNVNDHYTMSLPGVTDWTGFPMSGKTQVLMEFLLATSEFYGWRHLVYFPDVGNPTEIIADLIHKRTGKSFDKRHENHITDQERLRETPWILEHFLILTKNDLKAKLSPYEFWDLAASLKKEGVQTASIDSWKDMKHDTKGFGRDDKYLEDVLSYRNSMSDKHKQHYHTIIHPLKTERDNAGNRKPPMPYDLKGGTEWFNNGRCMVTVHRPAGSTDGAVELFWNKIKPRSIGEVGKDEIFFDVRKFRYYIKDRDGRRYATEVYKKIAPQEMIENINNDPDDLPF